MALRAIRALVLVGVAVTLGFTLGIFPATAVALAVGPIDQSKWGIAGVLAGLPYVVAASYLVINWRRHGVRQPTAAFLAVAFLAAAVSSGLYFVATFESQF